MNAKAMAPIQNTGLNYVQYRVETWFPKACITLQKPLSAHAIFSKFRFFCSSASPPFK